MVREGRKWCGLNDPRGRKDGVSVTVYINTNVSFSNLTQFARFNEC